MAVVLAVIVAVILGITSGATFGENVVGTILSPIRTGIAAIDRQAERYYNYIFGYEALKAENAELQKRILEMEEDVRTAEQYQRENEQLKTLLGLSEEHEDYSFVSAYIISWDSSDYKSAFTIGKGTNSGLEEGMCAVTENGQVVGLITKVGVNWATITTIMDSSLEISASIASSGYTGVVQGTYLPDGSSILRMNYLLTDAIIKKRRSGRHDRLDALPERPFAWLYHKREPGRDGRCRVDDDIVFDPRRSGQSLPCVRGGAERSEAEGSLRETIGRPYEHVCTSILT